MVSPLFFYQLVLFALIWIFIVLHLTWTQRVVTALAAPALPEPLTPTRPRSNESKPFEELTQKPHCALCEQDPAYPPAPPPVPPDPMPPTHRRPPCGRHLHALLSPYGLSLSGLARAW